MSLSGISEPSGSGCFVLGVILLLLSCLVSFVYETEHFNGVAELLEILGRFVDHEFCSVLCGSEDSGTGFFPRPQDQYIFLSAAL